MSDDKHKERIRLSIKHWRSNPLDWVKDKFPSVKLSTQQVVYFSELGKLITAKIKAHDTPDELTADEKELASKIGISIMAGQGVGKDFITAMTMCFFLDVFPYPKITATGLTGKHLRNVLWSECAKVMSLAVKNNPDDPQSLTVLESILTWQTERIFHKGIKNPGSRWFAEAVTVNPNANEEEQGKTLYGRHEDYQLIVVDEAANVPEPVFGPLEGTLTRKCCIALMIFNPTRSKGYAYDSHYRNKGQWLCLNWNAEESELVSREHIEKMKRYGVDSNTYRVKVKGLPPLHDDNSLIPWDWIEDAVLRDLDIDEFDPIMSGADVGGGGDKSVYIYRQGGIVEWPKFNSDKDTMNVSDWIQTEMTAVEADVVFVDIIGLGRGVYDKLRRDRVSARPADSRSTASDPERFFNSRAEMYWKLREQFEHKLIKIPDCEELKNELGAMKFDPTRKNKIPEKREIKKVLGHSPDIADALAMTYLKPDSLFRRNKDKKNRNKISLDGVFLR